VRGRLGKSEWRPLTAKRGRCLRPAASPQTNRYPDPDASPAEPPRRQPSAANAQGAPSAASRVRPGQTDYDRTSLARNISRKRRAAGRTARTAILVSVLVVEAA